MRVLLVCFVLVSSSSFAQDTLLNHIRKNIGELFTSDDVCENIYEAFEESGKPTEDVLLGYYGATLIGMSRHHPNPFKKMGFLNDGTESLEEAVNNQPDNIELRFLRLTIQTYMPAFLGYDDDKEKDKQFVLDNLASAKNEQFQERARNFIKQAESQGKL